MDVQEAVLYSEIRKIQNKQSEDHTRKEQQEIQIQAAKPAPVVSDKILVNPFETEEREIIRVLLKFFHEKVFEVEDEETKEVNICTVGVYVLSELQNDGLTSVNPHVQFIIQTLEQNVYNKDFDPIKFFTHYPDASISQFASNIMADKYIESKRWSKGGAFIESESELLYLLVPKLVQEYKSKKVKMMLKKLEHQIKEASKNNQTDQLMDYMGQHMKLKEVLRDLSALLGFRTIS
jgi:DNA primase